MNKFNFGDSAKDIVSGLTGIITGRFEYINGCVRYQLDPPKLNKEGKPQEGFIFDEGQIVLVKAGAVKIPAKDTGGPMATPGRPHGQKL